MMESGTMTFTVHGSTEYFIWQGQEMNRRKVKWEEERMIYQSVYLCFPKCSKPLKNALEVTRESF
jgi:hypothetical protein